MLTDTRNSEYAQLSGLDGKSVSWTGNFWKDAVDVCAKNMVPQLQHMFEAKDISHVVENFRICAGEADGDFDGTFFGDGDFYKWMEAELYSAVLLQDETRFEKLRSYIRLIGKAQQPDGYLSTKQIIAAMHGESARNRDINEFEVYNMGHLFTSACLYKRMTGDDSFLIIAEKAAGYLNKLYDQAEKNGNVQTAVCPSHYMGLIELYRTTGKRQYLDLAAKAIRLRDSVKNGMDDNQDRIPLKQHHKIIGHAVRATYLYAGVADLYAEEGDPDYLRVLHDVWHNMVSTKMYITGGIGALYNGMSPYGNFFIDQKIHQAFGYEYQLPNITAYNETCAAVGLIMWAYRMFLVEPKAEYIDVLERSLLNAALAAVSLDGKKFFYENMLRRAKKLDYELIWPLTRTEYILSYCCPPNLARLIMESPEYAYAVSGDAVYTGLYGQNRTHFRLSGGADFVLEEITDYPYDGEIRFRVSEVTNDAPVTLMLRVPGWAEDAEITCCGKTAVCGRKAAGTYQPVRLASLVHGEIVLKLPMKARCTMANPMVEEDTSQIAIERGPLVYCMEQPDADADTLDDIWLDPEATFELRFTEMEGRRIGTLETTAYRRTLWKETPDGDHVQELYRTLPQTAWDPVKARLIPYFAWDNRGEGEMRIWMPYRTR